MPAPSREPGGELAREVPLAARLLRGDQHRRIVPDLPGGMDDRPAVAPPRARRAVDPDHPARVAVPSTPSRVAPVRSLRARPGGACHRRIIQVPSQLLAGRRTSIRRAISRRTRRAPAAHARSAPAISSSTIPFSKPAAPRTAPPLAAKLVHQRIGQLFTRPANQLGPDPRKRAPLRDHLVAQADNTL